MLRTKNLAKSPQAPTSPGNLAHVVPGSPLAKRTVRGSKVSLGVAKQLGVCVLAFMITFSAFFSSKYASVMRGRIGELGDTAATRPSTLLSTATDQDMKPSKPLPIQDEQGENLKQDQPAKILVAKDTYSIGDNLAGEKKVVDDQDLKPPKPLPTQSERIEQQNDEQGEHHEQLSKMLLDRDTHTIGDNSAGEKNSEKKVTNEENSPSKSTAQEIDSSKTTANKAKSNKAYAFYLGGIPSPPEDGSDLILPAMGNGNPEQAFSVYAYRGLLYNILVSVRILRDSGSTADFIVLVQMATPFAELPPEDVRWLTALHIRIQYVPGSPAVVNELHTLQVEKFRILDLVEYRRVLYLDADVTPHCNLDYIMDRSMTASTTTTTPLLQENFAISIAKTPTSGAFFMLTPGPGYYRQFLEIILKQANSGSFLGGAGWGKWMNQKKGDHPWRAITDESNYEWNFEGVTGDQGLLYMWTRFARKKLSIARGPIVEVWLDGKNAENIADNPLLPHSCLSQQEEAAVDDSVLFSGVQERIQYLSPKGVAPYRDFTLWRYANENPWHNPLAPPANAEIKTSMDRWFRALRRLDEELQMGLGLVNTSGNLPDGISGSNWKVVPKKEKQKMYPVWGINPKSLVQMALRMLSNPRSIVPWEPPVLTSLDLKPSPTIAGSNLREKCECSISTSTDPCSLRHRSLEEWLSDRAPLLLSSQRPLCPNAARNNMHVVIPVLGLPGETIKSSMCSVVCQDYLPEKMSIYLFGDGSDQNEVMNQWCEQDHILEYDPSQTFNAETMRILSPAPDESSANGIHAVTCIKAISLIQAGPAKYWALRHVETRAGANDIIVFLGQGDVFSTPNALQLINTKYIETGGWAAFSRNDPRSNEIVNGSVPLQPRQRAKINNAGSLLTFKVHLLGHVHVEDFKGDASNQDFYVRIMELAGADRLTAMSLTLLKNEITETETHSNSEKKLESSARIELPLEVVFSVSSPSLLREQLLWLQEQSLAETRRIHIHLLNEKPEWKDAIEGVLSAFVAKQKDGSFSAKILVDVKLSAVEAASGWSEVQYVDGLRRKKPLDCVVILAGTQYWAPNFLSSLMQTYKSKSMTAWNSRRFDNRMADFDRAILSGEKMDAKQFAYIERGGSVVDANLWLFGRGLAPQTGKFENSPDMWFSYVMDALLGWELQLLSSPIPVDVSLAHDDQTGEKLIPSLPEGQAEKLRELRLELSEHVASLKRGVNIKELVARFWDLQTRFHWNVVVAQKDPVDILPYSPLAPRSGIPTNSVPTTKTTTKRRRAFVCVTGQFDRFEAESKVTNIIKPLQQAGYEIDTALILSHKGDTAFTNQDFSDRKNLKTDSQPFFGSFEDAVKFLESNNINVLFAANGTYSKVENPPLHNGYLQLLFKLQSRDIKAQTSRVLNHARIFDSYKRCLAYADAASQEATGAPIGAENLYYDVFLRIREDVGLSGPLTDAVLKDVFPPPPSSITVTDCRGWHGINDRFAIVSPDIARVYFERPYEIISQGKYISDKVVRNPESLLLYAYVTAKINVLGHQELNNLNRMHKNHKGKVSVNSADRSPGCPKPRSLEYLVRQNSLYGWYL